MNTTSTRQTVILGLFICFGIGILVLSIFAIGGIRESLQRQIEVKTVFAEVSGLKAGDAIWFAGVPVGTVRDVSFQSAGVQVTMRVDQSASAFIPSDALTKIGSDSLIGNKLVVIYEGSPEAPTLADGATLASTTTVTPTQIMEQLQLSNDNLLVITTNLRTVSAQLADEQGSVSQLLKDGELYVKVRSTVDGLEQASRSAVAITKDGARFAAELNRPGNLPHDLVTDTKIHPSLVASATTFEEMVTGLKADITNPETPVGVLLHDQSAGADLGSTFENLDRSSALLAEDLEALQHNFLLRRFFKKRDKAAAKAEAAR